MIDGARSGGDPLAAEVRARLAAAFHLARSALSVLDHLDPDREAVAIPDALRTTGMDERQIARSARCSAAPPDLPRDEPSPAFPLALVSRRPRAAGLLQ